MRFVLLYLVFADSFNFFSFGKYKRFLEIRNYFSNLSVLSLKIHLCIIYFISAIHKIHSDVWFNGVATYYTMNIERFNGTPYNLSLSKNSIFVTLSTYSTWFLELSYPFLVWFKASRKYIITLMIILHLSIAIFMMLYDFQILFIVVQGFFFVNEEFVANAKIRYSKIINLRLRLNKN